MMHALLLLLSVLIAPAQAATGPCYQQDLKGCTLSGQLTAQNAANLNGITTLNNTSTPLTVNDTNPSAGAVGTAINLTASNGTSTGLQILQPNLPAGSSLSIAFGVSTAANGEAVESFTPNATANQSTWSLGLAGNAPSLQVRGDGAIFLNGAATVANATTPLTVNNSNPATAVGAAINLTASNVSSTGLQMLQPSLPAGSSLAIAFGVSTALENEAIISFTPNATPVQATLNFGLMGDTPLLQVRGDGAILNASGNKLNFKQGAANATAGVITMVAGLATVNTTAIGALATPGVAGDVIALAYQNCNTNKCGTLFVGPVTPGTSFVIDSTNAADVSTVYWRIDHLY